MQKQLGFILLILSITTFSFTQQNDKSDSQSEIKQIIQGEFEAQFGEGWQFSWNLNSTPHRIFGGNISQQFDATDPIESEYAAREFISENQIIYNLPEVNLDLWVNEQHGSLRYLIFNQVYQNISVWNARIDFRYRLNGDLVMTGMDAYPNLSVDINPSINLDESITFAKNHIGFDENLNDEVVDDPEIIIWVESGKESVYHLAYQIELFVHSTDPKDETPIHRWQIFVDAHNGEILEKFDEVRTATVEGHVTGGVKDEPFGMESNRGMPHVKVNVSGVGNTYTDANGYYSIDIGNTSRSVTVKLEGSYLNTNNANGSDASITRTVSPGTTENFDFAGFNSIAGERDTYYHANIVHDLAKSIHPSFTGADYVMPAKVNIGSEDAYWPCNAYWDYTGINLFSEGGGCAGTDEMADVVYHEYGHGLAQFIYDPYSPPYSSSGLSEGCADYWGITLTNTPCLGNGFFGEGTCLRDGDNTLQYPANSCGGEVHCLGEYIMGALWKMRENLIALHGYENGVEISDNIFYWAQTGRPNNDMDFLTEILLADDNDGSIENGTPNYMPICAGFEAHNMNCPYEGPFADLEFSSPSLNFVLASGETESQELTISNVGEPGSVLTFNSGVSPFAEIGDGPDAFGNFWSDSDLDSDISEDWVDIDGMGTLYNFPHNDEAGEQIDIGFNFPFLGGDYSQCIINANGWIGFGSDATSWENLSIPSSGAPGPAIFGLWDDLNPVNDQCNTYCSGEVYYYSDGDKLVVWFDNVAHWWTNFEDSYYDFQFVLYSDGKIDLNYNTLTGSHTATIGIQDASGTNGLEVAFDQAYLHDGLSLKFSQGPEWISVTPPTGQVDAGSSETLVVEANANGLDDGMYDGYLRMVTSGGNAGLAVSLMVSGNPSLPGDINGDESVNIQDIIFLINFILGTDDPDAAEFNAADINGDNVLNIQDIILIVNLILD
ncbi:MAG: PepSY domain-containing protein [Candidatus Marinimicrobia bacterium]|nr:PepSY domain-containing protein [Candidatus Neomarinimicrobiota bacterium]